MRHSILFDLLLHIFQHRDIRTCFLSLTPFFQILPCFRILKDTVESQSPEKPDAFFHKFPVIICRTVKIAEPDIDIGFACFFIYHRIDPGSFLFVTFHFLFTNVSLIIKTTVYQISQNAIRLYEFPPVHSAHQQNFSFPHTARD